MKHWFVQTLLRLLVLTKSVFGGLAQLARALAWHARGQRFDPVILHAVDNRIRMVMNRQTIFDMLLQTKL